MLSAARWFWFDGKESIVSRLLKDAAESPECVDTRKVPPCFNQQGVSLGVVISQLFLLIKHVDGYLLRKFEI